MRDDKRFAKEKEKKSTSLTLAIERETKRRQVAEVTVVACSVCIVSR